MKLMHRFFASAPTWQITFAAVLLAFCGIFSSASALTIDGPLPGDEITVTASSTFSPLQDPKNLIQSAAMPGDLHNNDGSATSMWHSAERPASSSPAPGIPSFPGWLRFDFRHPQALSAVKIWNHNQANYTDRGFQRARIFGSADGEHWSAAQEIVIPRASGKPEQPCSLTVKWNGAPVKSIVIAAESTYGSSFYGLSAVRFLVPQQIAEFPSDLEFHPKAVYRHRADGEAGREIRMDFQGGRIFVPFEVVTEVVGGKSETMRVPADPNGTQGVTVLLPPGAGVETDVQVFITVKTGNARIQRKLVVPHQRQWTIFIFPHSHVDIGYTNTQANVEIIHKRNIDRGIDLAKATATYPEGARYLWNSEVGWPVERYLNEATPSLREKVFDAIRKGYLDVDAGYINDNTSASADEELDAMFSFAKSLEKSTGAKIDTMVQTDVPGLSWGIVPAAAQAGIRYILALNNGGDRTGHSMDLSHHPFWWIGPDGNSKVLFLQPGSYAVGAQLKGLSFALSMMGQTDPAKLPLEMKTSNPREHFIDGYLWPTLERLEKSDFYPYDIFPISWSMADNTPIDADLPQAVKSWNEEYAYPHLVIATAHEIMSAFDKKYGAQIPAVKGDFTEYWTDGLGTAAKQTAMNRASKERLIEADTLWTMLNRLKPAPRADFDEAWRYVLLGDEHTWCYSNPWKQPLQDEIKKVKFGYFQEAEDRSKALFSAALKPVAEGDGKLVTVLNSLNWNRAGLVTIDGAVAGLTDPNGKQIPVQKLSTGETVLLAGEVPGFGAATYRVTSAATSANPFHITGTSLDNGRVKVTLDPVTGDIVSLVAGGREFASDTGPCRLNSFRYLNGGAPPEKASGPSDVTISIKENGPVVASLLVASKAEGCRQLTREVRLVAGQPDVEIIDTLDKEARTAKEGVHFGFAFNIANPCMHMDIPWGVAQVETDQLPEGNRNWIAFQRWLDISGLDSGVTWCSLDAPVFESGNITANIIGSTGAWIRHLDPSATVYSWALNNHWHTNFPLSQEGRIVFRYRVLPHLTGYDPAQANRFGMEQARPLIGTFSTASLSVTAPVAIDNPRVVVSSLKTSANGKSLIVRLRSLSPEPEAVSLSWPAGKPGALHYVGDDVRPKMADPGPVQIPPWGVVTLEAAFE